MWDIQGERVSLNRAGWPTCLLTCSEYLYTLLTASWSWPYSTFAPAQPTEGCRIAQFSWRLPIHCGHFCITFSTLGMEEQYQKRYIFPFRKEERLSVTSSLFYLKKMQSTSWKWKVDYGSLVCHLIKYFSHLLSEYHSNLLNCSCVENFCNERSLGNWAAFNKVFMFVFSAVITSLCSYRPEG